MERDCCENNDHSKGASINDINIGERADLRWHAILPPASGGKFMVMHNVRHFLWREGSEAKRNADILFTSEGGGIRTKVSKRALETDTPVGVNPQGLRPSPFFELRKK